VQLLLLAQDKAEAGLVGGMMALPHPIFPWTRKPSLNGWSITNTATIVSSLSFTARSVAN
jgi:hypothetical protein